MRTDQQQQSTISDRWMFFLGFGAFASMLFGIKLWLIYTYGNATPFWDQWDAEAADLYQPFIDGTLSWADLIAPHNEHRILTTRLLALALLMANDIWNPLLQMVVNAGLHIVTLVVGIALLTRVIGRNHLPALLVFSLILFGLPHAWENSLECFQSQFYFVLLFSVACLWLTVTTDPLSTRWWVGVVCSMLAFLSLASGIFALAAAASVGLVFFASALRRTRKQLLAVIILAGLFIAGSVLTPSIEGHAALKATSLPQFFNALMAALGWPISSNFLSALIRNLPAIIFVGVMLWKRPTVNNRKWFLLALVVWTLGQAVSIAYGRAVGILSSRYLDLFEIGILVNFACLISIVQDHVGKRYGWAIVGVSLWVVTVMFSLGIYSAARLPVELAGKRDTGLAQEINTRNYLTTGDINHLKDKPYFHVPYPNPERLASILASPTVRAILPTNISRPLTPTSIDSMPADAFVANGYYPTTPKRTDWTLGSYGAQGDAATGQATIRFDANQQSALLAIPVAGYPLNNDIKLEIEQNGQRKPVAIKSNPRESWGMAYIKVDKGPFSIMLTDLSKGNTGWLAVGAPVVTGRWDALANGLLANYLVFIMLGLVAGVLLVTQCGLTSRVTKSVGD